MAGLDTRGASNFIGMLQEFGLKNGGKEATQDPVQLCTETIKTTQMASDALLLKDRDVPLSQQPYSGCCDTLVAKVKEINLAIEELISNIGTSDHNKMCNQLSQVTSTMCIIIETTAQAVYMVSEKTPGCVKAVPSAIDGYVLQRGRLAIEIAARACTRGLVQKEQMMSIAAVFATHLELIREQCLSATTALKDSPLEAAQFSAVAKSLAANASILVTSIKVFVASPNQESQASVATFAKPILALVDALIELSSLDKFVGKPPQVKREVADYIKPMQAGALSASSAMTLLIATIKVVLTNPSEIKSKDQIANYTNSIQVALQSLLVAMKSARDAKMMFEDPK